MSQELKASNLTVAGKAPPAPEPIGVWDPKTLTTPLANIEILAFSLLYSLPGFFSPETTVPPEIQKWLREHLEGLQTSSASQEYLDMASGVLQGTEGTLSLDSIASLYQTALSYDKESLQIPEDDGTALFCLTVLFGVRSVEELFNNKMFPEKPIPIYGEHYFTFDTPANGKGAAVYGLQAYYYLATQFPQDSLNAQIKRYFELNGALGLDLLKKLDNPYQNGYPTNQQANDAAASLWNEYLDSGEFSGTNTNFYYRNNIDGQYHEASLDYVEQHPTDRYYVKLEKPSGQVYYQMAPDPNLQAEYYWFAPSGPDGKPSGPNNPPSAIYDQNKNPLTWGDLVENPDQKIYDSNGAVIGSNYTGTTAFDAYYYAYNNPKNPPSSYKTPSNPNGFIDPPATGTSIAHYTIMSGKEGQEAKQTLDETKAAADQANKDVVAIQALINANNYKQGSTYDQFLHTYLTLAQQSADAANAAYADAQATWNAMQNGNSIPTDAQFKKLEDDKLAAQAAAGKSDYYLAQANTPMTRLHNQKQGYTQFSEIIHQMEWDSQRRADLDKINAEWNTAFTVPNSITFIGDIVDFVNLVNTDPEAKHNPNLINDVNRIMGGFLNKSSGYYYYDSKLGAYKQASLLDIYNNPHAYYYEGSAGTGYYDFMNNEYTYEQLLTQKDDKQLYIRYNGIKENIVPALDPGFSYGDFDVHKDAPNSDRFTSTDFRTQLPKNSTDPAVFYYAPKRDANGNPTYHSDSMSYNIPYLEQKNLYDKNGKQLTWGDIYADSSQPLYYGPDQAQATYYQYRWKNANLKKDDKYHWELDGPKPLTAGYIQQIEPPHFSEGQSLKESLNDLHEADPKGNDPVQPQLYDDLNLGFDKKFATQAVFIHSVYNDLTTSMNDSYNAAKAMGASQEDLKAMSDQMALAQSTYTQMMKDLSSENTQYLLNPTPDNARKMKDTLHTGSTAIFGCFNQVTYIYELQPGKRLVEQSDAQVIQAQQDVNDIQAMIDSAKACGQPYTDLEAQLEAAKINQGGVEASNKNVHSAYEIFAADPTNDAKLNNIANPLNQGGGSLYNANNARNNAATIYASEMNAAAAAAKTAISTAAGNATTSYNNINTEQQTLGNVGLDPTILNDELATASDAKGAADAALANSQTVTVNPSTQTPQQVTTNLQYLQGQQADAEAAAKSAKEAETAAKTQYDTAMATLDGLALTAKDNAVQNAKDVDAAYDAIGLELQFAIDNQLPTTQLQEDYSKALTEKTNADQAAEQAKKDYEAFLNDKTIGVKKLQADEQATATAKTNINAIKEDADKTYNAEFTAFKQSAADAAKKAADDVTAIQNDINAINALIAEETKLSIVDPALGQDLTNAMEAKADAEKASAQAQKDLETFNTTPTLANLNAIKGDQARADGDVSTADGASSQATKDYNAAMERNKEALQYVEASKQAEADAKRDLDAIQALLDAEQSPEVGIIHDPKLEQDLADATVQYNNAVTANNATKESFTTFQADASPTNLQAMKGHSDDAKTAAGNVNALLGTATTDSKTTMDRYALAKQAAADSQTAETNAKNDRDAIQALIDDEYTKGKITGDVWLQGDLADTGNGANVHYGWAQTDNKKVQETDLQAFLNDPSQANLETLQTDASKTAGDAGAVHNNLTQANSDYNKTMANYNRAAQAVTDAETAVEQANASVKAISDLLATEETAGLHHDPVLETDLETAEKQAGDAQTALDQANTDLNTFRGSTYTEYADAVVTDKNNAQKYAGDAATTELQAEKDYKASMEQYGLAKQAVADTQAAVERAERALAAIETLQQGVGTHTKPINKGLDKEATNQFYNDFLGFYYDMALEDVNAAKQASDDAAKCLGEYQNDPTAQNLANIQAKTAEANNAADNAWAKATKAQQPSLWIPTATPSSKDPTAFVESVGTDVLNQMNALKKKASSNPITPPEDIVLIQEQIDLATAAYNDLISKANRYEPKFEDLFKADGTIRQLRFYSVEIVFYEDSEAVFDAYDQVVKVADTAGYHASLAHEAALSADASVAAIDKEITDAKKDGLNTKDLEEDKRLAVNEQTAAHKADDKTAEDLANCRKSPEDNDLLQKLLDDSNDAVNAAEKAQGYSEDAAVTHQILDIKANVQGCQDSFNQMQAIYNEAVAANKRGDISDAQLAILGNQLSVARTQNTQALNDQKAALSIADGSDPFTHLDELKALDTDVRNLNETMAKEVQTMEITFQQALNTNVVALQIEAVALLALLDLLYEDNRNGLGFRPSLTAWIDSKLSLLYANPSLENTVVYPWLKRAIEIETSSASAPQKASDYRAFWTVAQMKEFEDELKNEKENDPAAFLAALTAPTGDDGFYLFCVGVLAISYGQAGMDSKLIEKFEGSVGSSGVAMYAYMSREMVYYLSTQTVSAGAEPGLTAGDLQEIQDALNYNLDSAQQGPAMYSFFWGSYSDPSEKQSYAKSSTSPSPDGFNAGMNRLIANETKGVNSTPEMTSRNYIVDDTHLAFYEFTHDDTHKSVVTQPNYHPTPRPSSSHSAPSPAAARTDYHSDYKPSASAASSAPVSRHRASSHAVSLEIPESEEASSSERKKSKQENEDFYYYQYQLWLSQLSQNEHTLSTKA